MATSDNLVVSVQHASVPGLTYTSRNQWMRGNDVISGPDNNDAYISVEICQTGRSDDFVRVKAGKAPKIECPYVRLTASNGQHLIMNLMNKTTVADHDCGIFTNVIIRDGADYIEPVTVEHLSKTKVINAMAKLVQYTKVDLDPVVATEKVAPVCDRKQDDVAIANKKQSKAQKIAASASAAAVAAAAAAGAGATSAAKDEPQQQQAQHAPKPPKPPAIAGGKRALENAPMIPMPPKRQNAGKETSEFVQFFDGLHHTSDHMFNRLCCIAVSMLEAGNMDTGLMMLDRCQQYNTNQSRLRRKEAMAVSRATNGGFENTEDIDDSDEDSDEADDNDDDGMIDNTDQDGVNPREAARRAYQAADAMPAPVQNAA